MSFVKWGALVVLVTSLTACIGGKEQPPVVASGGEVTQATQVTKDITRPPQTIVGREEVKERNPEETISFDEWRKLRAEELRKQQAQ